MKKRRVYSFVAVLGVILVSLFSAGIASESSVLSFSDVDNNVFLPIKNFYKNQTVRSFGVFVSEGRFHGFHSGVDVEVGGGEQIKDVPIFSIADGVVVESRFASGYGGVVAIRHKINSSEVFGVYGHLRLKDAIKTGRVIRAGELVGYLGEGYTGETDGARKHLHFGLFKRAKLSILGYVDNQEELRSWINPTQFLRDLGAK